MNKLNSLVIWVDNKEDSDYLKESVESTPNEIQEESNTNTPSLELDINLWKPDDDNGYLEIGFRIFNWSNKSCLHCILPFSLKRTEIIDKSPFLREHPAVLEALFNDSLTIETVDDDPRFSKITRSESKFYLFSPERNLRIEDTNNDDEQENTHIIVDIPKDTSKLDSKIDIYVRLRFKPSSYSPIITNENLPARFFSGMSEKMTFIDFRINSMRSISYSLRTKAKSTKIKKVNFFLIVDAWSQVVMGTTEHGSARLLEEKIWSDFINHNTESKDKSYLVPQWVINKQSKSMHYVAYNWLEDRTTNKIGYDNFIKVKSSKSSWRSLFMTIGAIIFAGVVASTIANIFWSHELTQSYLSLAPQQEQKNASNQ